MPRGRGYTDFAAPFAQAPTVPAVPPRAALAREEMFAASVKKNTHALRVRGYTDMLISLCSSTALAPVPSALFAPARRPAHQIGCLLPDAMPAASRSWRLTHPPPARSPARPPP